MLVLPQNPCGIGAAQAIAGLQARSVTHQATGRNEFAPGKDRRDRMARRQQDELNAR
jgi:hypothetical protein